ncbi:class I adenylate-forming enzyme family protein [Gracilibacillus xinjiangensis]|uniref:Class I adenylate-forming enzyme family protein n=1 Tax=Gracilibacillus xinjiangensis TaxID=1193282 RepID=A0ABV8WR08_9BACI
MTTLIDYSIQKEYLNEKVICTFQQDFTPKEVEQMCNNFLKILGGGTSLSGKRVALLVPNTFSYLSLIFAINKLGGTVIPVSPLYREGDLSSILSCAAPHVIFTINEYNGVPFAEIIKGWLKESKSDCILYETIDGTEWKSSHYKGVLPKLDKFNRHFILFTSGSTGTPKGVVLSQDALLENIKIITRMFHAKRGDCILNIPPQTVGFGLVVLLGSFRYGYTVAVPDAFDFRKIADMMERVDVKKMITTPSLLKAMYGLTKHLKPKVFENIHQCFLAGEMVSEGEVQAYPLMQYTKFYGIYGITEGGGIMTCNLRKKLEWTVAEGIQYKVVNGEFIIRSSTLFSGYYDRPNLTKEVKTNDGWLMTGDLVQLTKERKVVILGRKKDMIKKGGQQVIPGEVEEVLSEHDSVKQTAVIGAPHSVYGEQIVAYVVLEKELDAQALYQYCAERIARFKVPDRIEFLDELPVISGKTDKKALRKLFSIKS